MLDGPTSGMTDESPAFERFIALAKRELQADDVRLLGLGEVTPEADNVLVSRLRDGRHVVATFAEAPEDRDALERRLVMLANTFVDALASPPSEKTRARPPVATSLHEELKALAARARALDVLVIDTDSPVVWGCASVPARPRAQSALLLREVSEHELASRADDGDLPPPVESSASLTPTGLRDSAPVPIESSASVSEGDEEPSRESDAARAAVASIRRLPELDGLRKGRHLRHVERETSFYLAMSFSGIYILCLVFDGSFDELRAERAAADALPRIERLVLALPPLDPEPLGGVVALRRRQRR